MSREAVERFEWAVYVQVWAFTGMPYAAAPVGKMRWQPPLSLKAAGKCWKGTFDATKFGNACVQKVPQTCAWTCA